MQSTRIIIFILLIFFVSGLTAQELAEPHILSKTDIATPDSAILGDVAWLAGHWRGPAFNGTGEELWSPAAAGAMMGVYRYIGQDENVNFYEIMIIKEEAGSLILKLKHFSADLIAWEEKEKTIDFPLLKKTPSTLYFSGITFHKISDTEMVIYLRLRSKDGSVREEVFRNKRVG